MEQNQEHRPALVSKIGSMKRFHIEWHRSDKHMPRATVEVTLCHNKSEATFIFKQAVDIAANYDFLNSTEILVLEISDISHHQLEGIKFQLRDMEGGNLSLLCGDFSSEEVAN